MTDLSEKHGKLDIQVGKLKFIGEGEQDWLAAQLATVVSAAEAVSSPKAGEAEIDRHPSMDKGPENSSAFSTALGTHIRNKKAENNQTLRFLATADWLRQKGIQQLTTAEVAKALRENQQTKLGNPADCLNQNVSKGYCEKTKDGFFVTPEGLKYLGHAN